MRLGATSGGLRAGIVGDLPRRVIPRTGERISTYLSVFAPYFDVFVENLNPGTLVSERRISSSDRVTATFTPFV